MNKFDESITTTFTGLLTLNPGEDVEIRKAKIFKSHGREVMIEVLKMFIDENPDFELSNDYQRIKRLKNYF